MSNKSKFAALLESRRAEPTEEPAAADPAPPPPPTTTVRKAAPKAKVLPAVKRPRGRPGGQGKRINPAYTQVTAYIPEDLHLQTKINLLKSGKREFSELVEELLFKWNRGQPEPQAT